MNDVRQVLANGYTIPSITVIKVKSESGLAAGVRRIEATTGFNSLHFVQETEELNMQAARSLGTQGAGSIAAIEKLLADKKLLEKEVADLKRQVAMGGGSGGGGVEQMLAGARDVPGGKALAVKVTVSDASTLLGADVADPGVSAPSLENVQPGGLANWQARRTIAYIEANLASKMGTGDLANVVALSRSHFSRAFKLSLGLSPMEYVVVRRVERAKQLISSTRERLAEVALACGFADQAHLNRRFRDLIGMSPGRWRRSNVAVPKSAVHCGAEVQT